MNKRWWIIGLVVVLLAGAWYLFRPEKAFIDERVNEDFPDVTLGADNRDEDEEKPRLLAQGEFYDVAKSAEGKASIYELEDGSRTLRLTDFETSNGPDVHVVLVDQLNAADNETVKNAELVYLGKLKGNKGDQNYEIPEDVDLNSFPTVSIWCKRFAENFGAASLTYTE
ncbi:DM13 domain-containing protein [Desmospora profundinema]|uniref:DM13 domain-containing protein n=1 Tax=Desmospora profundinema TaxID=1571184 RepID=A0ABU1IS54_9BACL|nr:DM13 domain-containing protein [Desmospora profundinema]MDR6226754.1 hypothetical protein [Desmospora profundinema]